MLINEMPFILAAIITIMLTCHVAYVIKSDKRRQAQLNKRKTKNGQLAHDMYGRIYTRKFLLASAFFSLSWVLAVVSDFIKYGLGRDAALPLIIGLLSMVIGISGAAYGVHLLKFNDKSVRSGSEDDDW